MTSMVVSVIGEAACWWAASCCACWWFCRRFRCCTCKLCLFRQGRRNLCGAREIGTRTMISEVVQRRVS